MKAVIVIHFAQKAGSKHLLEHCVWTTTLLFVSIKLNIVFITVFWLKPHSAFNHARM